jgi:hypothetical protein
VTTDLYSILGVDPAATAAEIKERFRFLSHAYHPDKSATAAQREAAEREFKRVNEAYQVLSDPIERAKHDRERAQGTRTESAAASRPSPPPVSSRPGDDSVTRPPEATSRPITFVLLLWLIAAGMLVYAAVERHPYSFYVLLRWICCPIFAYSAFVAQEKNRLAWTWVFGVLAMLYNPIFRVHLDRSIWSGVNWFTVGAIIVAVVFWQDRASPLRTADKAADRSTSRSKAPSNRVVLAMVVAVILAIILVSFAIFSMRQPRNAGTRPTVSESRTADTTQQPQSQAEDFIVTAKDGPDGLILWVQERDSGRLLVNTVTNSIALNGDLDTGRRAALAVTSQRSGPNMPIASGVFMIERDTLSNGIYEASVHRVRPEEIKRVTPEEQARFEAWVRQFQPTPCVRDPSLPMDTVRLEPGVESKIRPGYFFPTRPARLPNYVPTQYVPAKVLRNDGAFLGWQYFAPAQLERLHEQPNAVSGRG